VIVTATGCAYQIS